MKIVVAVDGSEHAHHAVAWCAKYAEKLDAEVIAVFTRSSRRCTRPASDTARLRSSTHPSRKRSSKRVLNESWCAALSEAKVSFKSVAQVGYPSNVICAIAKSEDADLVVVGRRGRGGFAELMLGSTSHQLAHHVGRPLVIVP